MSNSNDDFLTENITISSISNNDYITGTMIGAVGSSGTDTITLTSGAGSSYYYNTGAGLAGSSGASYTIATGGTATTLGTIDISSATFNWFNSKPFEDSFPEWQDFQEMCKEYPGLEKTFEHLKAFYKLCIDDWEAKKKGD